MNGAIGSDRTALAPTAEADRRPAVAASHLSKSFRLPHEQYHTLKERAMHPFRSRSYDELKALVDVSFAVATGEFFGIVGRNGSGKSTLLKSLAGIYSVDRGDIEIHGRLSPFIELGVGFNMDLTARDNVIINAIMLGLTRSQAMERFDDIIAFAGLEEFIDLKLKNYSSGMYVRLAFATAVQVDADILLIDEVLAVGDANFQQKCFEELTRLQHNGHTMLFVTHDMGAVQRFCDRAMLLERGRVVDIGDPAAIARQYHQHNFRRSPIDAGHPESELPPTPPAAEVRNARFQSPSGEAVLTAPQGETCQVRIETHFNEALQDPIFAITLTNSSGQPVFSTNTQTQGLRTGHFAADSDVTLTIDFENWLSPGPYRLTASVARAGTGDDVLDAHGASSLLVHSSRAGGGLTDLPHTIELERG